ncbi:hypothetical protein FPSE_07925 [Fusarium pseudograminearum CS3096]|uniref:Rhodopsin domain-containing protein n=1 Tax=Fusarium pseudograminearum (strain CS3096) TaxID=1028729 RepID=K3VD56_FUSPC|nr:hypothetical protein FPSE_07925 [Fusarium pseudograminearum CS3096]EKJ71922.1 hypothetical protein FPSE_07925 [Fusarium pseudograminearum CS3096]
MTDFSVLVWAVRIYYRFDKKQVGIDDWLVTFATMFSVGLVVPNYYFFRYGYTGFPTDDISDNLDMEPVLLYNWTMQVLYNPILALVKSSLLFFLLRLGGHRCIIKWSIYILNTFNIALMIAIFLTVILQTIPINAFWDQSVTPRHQIDRPVFYISTAIITIVTDVLVLLIPFWVFVGLKMRLAAKLGLIVVFLAGGVVTIVGIFRMIELQKIFYHPGYDSGESLADTLDSVEVNLAIIACCGPALRPLFRKMFPRLLSSRSTKEAGKYLKSSKCGNATGIGGTIYLKDMHRSNVQTEIHSYSPDGSQKDIMRYTGILRTTSFGVQYDDAVSPEREAQKHDRRVG